MPIFMARLTRMVPLLIGIVVVLFVVYVVVSTMRNSTRAKEVVLKLCWWLCAIGSALCLLATLYAFLDGSELGVDMAVCFLITFLVAWLGDLVCARVFKRNHPSYRLSPTNPRPKTEKKPRR